MHPRARSEIIHFALNCTKNRILWHGGGGQRPAYDGPSHHARPARISSRPLDKPAPLPKEHLGNRPDFVISKKFWNFSLRCLQRNSRASTLCSAPFGEFVHVACVIVSPDPRDRPMEINRRSSTALVPCPPLWVGMVIGRRSAHHMAGATPTALRGHGERSADAHHMATPRRGHGTRNALTFGWARQ